MWGVLMARKPNPEVVVTVEMRTTGMWLVSAAIEAGSSGAGAADPFDVAEQVYRTMLALAPVPVPVRKVSRSGPRLRTRDAARSS